MHTWYFWPHDRGIVYNTLGAEHFSEHDGDWRPGEELVRECIQNSLDAGRDGEEVSVSFQVRAARSMTADAASFWFDSLWPHLLAEDCRLAGVPRSPEPAGFVVVEDFGTTGLEGDVEQCGLSHEVNRFFNFFRAEGVSGNSPGGTAGGSWGVGKSVFNRCSRINSFLALSTRHRTRDVVLMGRSVLRQHQIGRDSEFKPIGLFGVPDSETGSQVRPITDQALLERFCKDFRLTRPARASEDSAGLSVVMPFADEEIAADGIVDIVVRQYFHPILAGRLRVRVTDGREGSPRTVDLTRDSIIEYAQECQPPDVRRVLDLSRWSQGEDAQAAYVLREPPTDDKPEWNESLLRTDDSVVAELCQSFERGDPVAVRVPIYVHPANGPAERASFTVHLQRDLDGSGYRPVFVRGWIVVPSAIKNRIGSHSLFALVTIDEGPLAVMLRAAEPPAHTHWDVRTANFKGRYLFGKAVIEFVRGAPRFLAEAMSSADTERDFDIWADLFPAPQTEGERRGEGAGRKGRRRTPPGPIDPPPPRRKPFRIEPIESGGFVVARDNADTTPLPGRLSIRFAYDIGGPKSLRKYHRADFRAQHLARSIHAADEVECMDNQIVIVPRADDFRFELTGVDANRDLVVKVSSIADNEGSEE